MNIDELARKAAEEIAQEMCADYPFEWCVDPHSIPIIARHFAPLAKELAVAQNGEAGMIESGKWLAELKRRAEIGQRAVATLEEIFVVGAFTAAHTTAVQALIAEARAAGMLDPELPIRNSENRRLNGGLLEDKP